MTNPDKQDQTTWRKHRVAGAALVCLILYSLVGFLLAPWIVDKVASGKVHETLGAELRIGSIAINPFSFQLTVEDLEFDHPSGDPVARIGLLQANFELTALFSGVLRLAEVRVDRAEVLMHRDPQGVFNIASIRPLTETPPVTADEPATSGWPLEIDDIQVANLAFRMTDETVEPAAIVGLDDLELVVTGFSTAPRTSFPVAVSMNVMSGGSIEVEGDVTLLPDMAATLRLALDSISLALLHPYSSPRADLSFDSGELTFDGAITIEADEPFKLTGDAAIADLLVTETDDGTRLGSWDNLAIRQIDFSIASRSLSISEVIADRPYADILIAEDGEMNVRRVNRDADTTAQAAPPADDKPSFETTIGRVLINDASAKFEDRALPLPFRAQIAELNGQLSTIATSSTAPSEVSLEGRVDDYGQVVVSGHVTPLDPRQNTRIAINFENVEIPKFSAYTIRFAGREIASGKLDLELGYAVNESQLQGENNIVLRDFALGDEVAHPDSKSLPLNLAVALLKDASGNIDVDLPISGDIDDPEFSFGSVIGTAMGNLITNVATAPFKFLGRLLGVKGDELEALRFAPGRADLSPPQQEIAAKLAEALVARPQLALEIPGAWHVASDGLALREQATDMRIEAEIAEDDDALYSERRIAVIESLFVAETGEALPVGGGETDRVARAAALRDRLIAAAALSDKQLLELARARAANTRAAILATDPALETRVLTTTPKPVKMLDGEAVKMKIALSAQRQ
jgi:hypothetical protein